jgi:hypothetical protein
MGKARWLHVPPLDKVLRKSYTDEAQTVIEPHGILTLG